MESLADIVDAIDDAVVFEAYIFPSNSTSTAVAADKAAVASGYRAIGDNWHRLDSSPSEYLAHHIGHDLAHSSTQLVDVARCQSLAKSIIRHADDNCEWLANHRASFDQLVSGSYGWTPVSDWTFDIAYVAVGSKHTLFVCFFAED